MVEGLWAVAPGQVDPNFPTQSRTLLEDRSFLRICSHAQEDMIAQDIEESGSSI